MKVILMLLKRFLVDESGATAIEYALIASMIALVIIGSLRTIGTKLSAKFAAISGNLN
jgi:pilus assembly protein Flp/PilA